MLSTRILSALILAPLVILGVLWLDTRLFALLFALVLSLAIWEWSRLVSLSTMSARLAYTGGFMVLLALGWHLGPERILLPTLVSAVLWWLFALFWISRPQLCAAGSVACRSFKLLAGWLVCIPPWIVLVVLHRSAETGPQLVLILMIMVWMADIGAYFAGRNFGRHKLAPLVSPGKTREGVYGGMLLSLLFAALAGWWLSGSVQWTATFVAIAVPAMLFSVAGDLLESLMKRQSGIKDSGSIIPGHGGIFDRIDSLVAAAPVFMSGYLWMGLG